MKQSLLKVLFGPLLFLSGVGPGQATWYYASPGPSSFPPQQSVCYCAVAAVQGWITTLTGLTYSQYDIANAIDSKLNWDYNSCVFFGANAQEVANGLNAYAGSGAGYRRQFAYYEINQSQRDTAIVHVIKNLRRQMILATATVHSDGSMRAGGHWMVVWAADIDASGIVHGIRVHDPLSGSAWQGNYQVVSSGSTLRRFETFPKEGTLSDGHRSRMACCSMSPTIPISMLFLR